MSPLTRAVQTAKIVASGYEAVEQDTTSALEPDSAPDMFVHWLHDHAHADVVVAVGHEPHLGEPGR